MAFVATVPASARVANAQAVSTRSVCSIARPAQPVASASRSEFFGSRSDIVFEARHSIVSQPAVPAFCTATTQAVASTEQKTWYYVACSRKYMLEEEPTMEVLDERDRNFKKRGLPKDFFLVENPAFLNKPEFASVKAQIPGTPVAIVTDNRQFMVFMRLRLEFVVEGEFQATQAEATARA
eukprot:tig00000367_g24479.t1